MRSFFDLLWYGFKRFILIMLLVAGLGGSAIQARSREERISLLARPYEFDFLGWTLSAWLDKTSQANLSVIDYLPQGSADRLVLDYLQAVEAYRGAQSNLEAAYGDPLLVDREAELARLGEQVDQLQMRVDSLRPLAEFILEAQTSQVLIDYGLGMIDGLLPPVLFSVTPLPSALIVSPRDEIRQIADINLRLDVSLQTEVELETSVEERLNVSALVVPVGGLGTYPTMVQDTTSLSWLTEVVGHEWVHNYLSLHPLGLRYSESPELRTMNETTASLLGEAIGREVLRRNYPQFLPAEPSPENPPTAPEEPPAFDFRAEMRLTRLRVDELLSHGKVDEAEAYMEARRVVFWNHGYHIRRLNQAYFAFHGAYADQPGGAAGDDPVGTAVRELWARASSPAAFLRQMASMRSVDDLWLALSPLADQRR
ncbi:MAG: hypothetical protein ACK2T2_13025 [Anaerolineales bacterium]